MGGDRRRVIGLPATVVWWLASVALYIALIGTLSIAEAIAAIVVGALTVALSVAALRVSGIEVRATLPAFHRIPVVTQLVATESGAYLRALGGALRGRQPDSRFIAIPQPDIDPGLDTAITLELSSAPNSFVVEMLYDEGMLLIHQLEPSDRGRSSFPRWAP